MRGDPAHPYAGGMSDRWEYTWVYYEQALVEVAPDGPRVPRGPSDVTQGVWERLGDAGWEMAGMTTSPQGSTNGAVFKRRRADP